MRSSLPCSTFIEQTGKHARRIDEQSDGIEHPKTFVTTSTPDGSVEFLTFIDDESYRILRSSIPRPCVDIVPYDASSGRVLIGRRQQEPHPGDWVIGGRMYAGDTTDTSIIKTIKRELGITVDTTRLLAAGVRHLIWDTRQEPALESGGGVFKGSHDISHLFAYPVSPEELEGIRLNEEYKDMRWVDIFEIIDAPDGVYHPAFLDMVEGVLDRITTPSPENMTPEDRILYHLGAIATEHSRNQR